jgi:hypothetical protein
MLATIRAALANGAAIPYLGPGVLALDGADAVLPASAEALAARLTAAVSVPHKLRGNLTGAAQFIENFKHRRTVVNLMQSAFAVEATPNALHRFLAAQSQLRLLVHAWYDDLPQRALASRADWGTVQGLSQAEHFGHWAGCYSADGSRAETPEGWRTLLYQPLGSVAPAGNFLISDSDYVEVLTEIDIQTPIPDIVQSLRAGRNFLYLGCRFATQLERCFAHQISKRSSDTHWAVLPETPTRNEARFLAQHNIARIDMPLGDFVTALSTPAQAEAA